MIKYISSLKPDDMYDSYEDSSCRHRMKKTSYFVITVFLTKKYPKY